MYSTFNGFKKCKKEVTNNGTGTVNNVTFKRVSSLRCTCQMGNSQPSDHYI